MYSQFVLLYMIWCCAQFLPISATPSPTPRPTPTQQDAVHESVIVFSVLYSITLVFILITFYYERRLIKPVIIDHSARSNQSDFSAVQNFSSKFNISARIKAAVPPTEAIVWEDVSLIIAPISHLLMALVTLAIGYLLVIATSHSDSQLDLVVLLLFVLFASFAYVGVGLKQVVGKQHFKNIYAFTESRVIIIDYSHLNCRKPNIDYIGYYDISDVRLIMSDNDAVGSITFRKRCANQDSLFMGKGSFNSLLKSFDPSYCELLNIVNPRDAEKLLLRNISDSEKGKQALKEINYQQL